MKNKDKIFWKFYMYSVNTVKRFKKILLITGGVFLLLFLLVIIFISPLIKYLIEKYDVKYTGREITMSRAYVNPFTGYANFSNVKIYEEHSDSIALSSASISASIDVGKIFSGNYVIKQLTFDHPLWNVIQNKYDFNFYSFINHIIPVNPDTTLPSRFNILDIKTIDGEFHYTEIDPSVTYFIKEANIESHGKLWDADSVEFKFSFLSGPGSGSMKGNFTVNFKTLDYHYDIVIHQYDLSQGMQYIKPFVNYGSFTANLEADLKAKGNFSDGTNVTAQGRLDINDFHFGKNSKEDYLSFDKLTLAINDLSPKQQKYILDSLSLKHLSTLYEQYDNADNLQKMFNAKAALSPEVFNLLVEIGHYLKVLSSSFFESYYRINKLDVNNADLQYNDFSIAEKFSFNLNPLDITADSIDKNHDRIIINFKSGFEPFGNGSAIFNKNAKDSGNFELTYHIQKVAASHFNPYLISYTSFPLDRGTVEMHGLWHVRNAMIQSNNHLLLINPNVSKVVKNKNNSSIPMPLIMALIHQPANEIDLQIPITGNLKNPKFNLKAVFSDLFKKMFVKAPATHYKTEAKDRMNDMVEWHSLKWNMHQSSLASGQQKFVKKIAAFLVKNPETYITIRPQVYAPKEKEYILFFEAKKKYYLLEQNKNGNNLTEDDSEKIDKMSIRDSSFLRYLNKQGSDSMTFTIQDKCSKTISSSLVNTKFKQLNTDRENTFLSYFKKKRVEKQLKIYPAEYVIPYNGFSFYKIEYKGDMPKPLIKAYKDMNELNDKYVAKQFEERNKPKVP